MSSKCIFLGILLTSVLCYSLVQSEDDEDVEGPTMLTNKDGSLMDTKQQIDARQYKGESHSVTTDDGYVLTVYRITPAKPSSPAVILQHGLLVSSDSWVTDKDAIAFMLSDAGYDVWINNARGNCYSRNHTKLNADKDKSFWNFSFHEMATKDMPAVIDYVLKTTGKTKVHYIGLSMGTTIGFIMTSLKPEYNQKLKSLVAFSPIVFVSKFQEVYGPDGMFEEMVTKYMDSFKTLDKWEVFPRHDFFNNNKTQIDCNDIEENFQGMCEDKKQVFKDLFGGAYIPAGQSMKTIVHFHQMGRAGMLKYFNYDTPEENEKIYGSKEPPSYIDNFKSISAPTILWSSDHDGFTQPKDIDDLKPLLGNVIEDNRIKEECFDHMSFALARKVACLPVRENFYKSVIESLKKLD